MYIPNFLPLFLYLSLSLSPLSFTYIMYICVYFMDENFWFDILEAFFRHALSWFGSWVSRLLCVKLKIEFSNINNKKDFVGWQLCVLSVIFSHSPSIPSSVEFWKGKNNRWEPQVCYFNTNLHSPLPMHTRTKYTWQILIFLQGYEETTTAQESYEVTCKPIINCQELPNCTKNLNIL